MNTTKSIYIVSHPEANCNRVFLRPFVKKMKGIPDANRAKLIGYDNIQSDIPLPITLTTIGVDKEHHANFAVKQIIEKISDPQIKLAKHQSVKLFEGETA